MDEAAHAAMKAWLRRHHLATDWPSWAVAFIFAAAFLAMLIEALVS